jgi:hypothetical protein
MAQELILHEGDGIIKISLVIFVLEEDIRPLVL